MPIGWLVVAGIVLVAVVVCLVVALRRRRRRRIAAATTAALTAPAAEVEDPVVPGASPRAVGEPATAGSDAAPEKAPAQAVAAVPERAEVPGPAATAVAPSVATVGDLAALMGGRPVVTREARDPDTTPLPVSSDMLLQRAAARRASTSVRIRVPERGVATSAAVAADEPADETNVAAPWLRVDLTLADPTTPDDPAASGPVAGQPSTGDATASAGDEPGVGAPGAGLQQPADEPRTVAAQPESPTGAVLRAVPSPAPDAADRAPADEAAGAGRTLADAVANALANRAAADRTRTGPAAPAPDSAARDRLLAVLLDDPDRAVGATVELDRVREQLDRLVEAVRHEKDALAGLVDKLASAGLDDAQIARLAGIPAGEVATLRVAER
ncbi:MAG: hypothetical protein ABS81_25640 [Pseudonocardia sp. SCN 72-86]|nr:MAG: hypothetical protein ABS81_25640 [Pseudonocardia sp. SCN 72-86]